MPKDVVSSNKRCTSLLEATPWVRLNGSTSPDIDSVTTKSAISVLAKLPEKLML